MLSEFYLEDVWVLLVFFWVALFTVIALFLSDVCVCVTVCVCVLSGCQLVVSIGDICVLTDSVYDM